MARKPSLAQPPAPISGSTAVTAKNVSAARGGSGTRGTPRQRLFHGFPEVLVHRRSQEHGSIELRRVLAAERLGRFGWGDRPSAGKRREAQL